MMQGTATGSVAPTYGSGATLLYNSASSHTAGAEWATPFTAAGGVIISSTGMITMSAAEVFNASIPLTINNGATLATGNFPVDLWRRFYQQRHIYRGQLQHRHHKHCRNTKY